MFDGEKVIITEQECIERAYDAMEDCVRSIRNGSRKWAARSRGEAAMWEFMIYFEFGRDDSDWKTDRWYEMERIADGANV